MKKYTHLLLAGAMIPSIAHARNAIELSQYITGNYVDKNGQTLLHKFAQKSCDKSFFLKFDAHDFFENKFPAEIPRIKDKLDTLVFTYKFSPELATLLIVSQVAQFANQTDNNGDTALNLARKARQDAIDNGDLPHDRNEALINILEGFEPHNDELVELIESATN